MSIAPQTSFLYHIEEKSGEKVSLCYQCNKCSSGCPVTFAMDFPPHVLLRMVQLGLKEKVLGSLTPWVCASCETCTTRCPNGIDIARVMDTLRQMARVAPAGAEDIPKFHEAFLNSIKARGRVYEVGMLLEYMFKTDVWAKIKSREIIKETKLGWEMFRRGKMRLFPHTIRGLEDIKKIFEHKGK
ncbi:MAG: heterodisulfide reductase [Deltaproteobacteria bacterium]|nr:MAG: heterodisulfide reductase [Deltaproteobacteria bacterium]